MGIAYHGLEMFKKLGENYIKLETSERVLKWQELLKRCLEGVCGDTDRGLSRKDIQQLMKFHLNSTHWYHSQKERIGNDNRTIHIFAAKDERDKHNARRLRQVNTKDTPSAIIKSATEESCKTKSRDHYDNDRCPSKTCICVGCKVSLVGANIKTEWGLYHGSIGTVLGIVWKRQLDRIQKEMQKTNCQSMCW